MSKMIQIRNVPDEIHRKYKSRAALAGMSLSEYLLRELKKAAEKPSWEEWEARWRMLPRHDIPPGEIAESIRQGREERGQQLDEVARATRGKQRKRRA